ncbi:MAG TPA: PEP-CTERM sorting domain-containing protein [Actinomycetota bacterium]|nr:PEP-CTERM sorting domain-containing protein [Actinomycetota bacterium]
MKDIQAVLSALTVVLGVALLVYMVTVESEPGAIPLLLIAVGTGWFLVTRRRARAHSE